MGTDNDFPSADGNQDSTAPLSNSSTLSSPKRRRLTRSPTPHALADHFLFTSVDNNDDQDASFSSSTSTPSPVSETLSNDIHTTITCDDSEAAVVDDGPFLSAKMNLFASLTGMGPEEMELARLTKANTKANSLVGRIKDTHSSSPSSSNVSQAPLSSSSMGSITSSTRNIISSSTSSSPASIGFSFTVKNTPSSPQYMADNELEDEMGDETGSESSLSSWNGSPSLSPQFTTTPELDQRRRKRRRIEHSEHCPEQGMQIEPVPSSQDQEAEAEEGESSLCHQSNNDHESSSASLSSLTPPPLSQPTHPSQEEEEDGFCSSASTEPYSPIKARKNVRFDESRNTVFGYDRGSAIMLSQASNDDRPSCSFEDDDEDQEEILDYGFDQNDIGYEEDGTSDNVMSSPSSSLTLPSRWAWSSMVMAGGSCEPIPSDLEAAVSPGTTRMLQSDRDSTKDTGALQGGTVEESGYSSSQSSQFSQETFLNIASSLDRLWSPSRTPLSTISGLKRSASSLSSTTSSSPLASTSRAPSGPHKLPVLKRQSSMSVIDNAESSESSGHETPHQQSPALLRRQGSFNKEAAPEDAKAVSSQPSEKLQIQAEKDDMAMQEEPPVDSLSKQVDRVRLMSPPLTGERRVVRGMVRNREGLGRTFAHPYKRRAPVDEDPSTVATGTTGAATAASSSSVSSTPFMPPRLARAASFSVARQPNNKPPMLRREASTTALMDTLS